MLKNQKIYVAGHRGLVGSAIVRCLRKEGYENLLLRTRSELDLIDKEAVDTFFAAEKPAYVFLAAAKVGGIHANDTQPADFIYENLAVQNNVLHAAAEFKVEKLLFLGSSCIYPRLAPQPMREEYLLSGPLEPTNSAYAVAKIAGIEMCYAFNRQYKTNFVPVMPTNLYGPFDNYDLMNSHAMPAMIRKFHLAKLAAAGDNRALAADVEKYGQIPPDFYASLMRIAASNGHTLDCPGSTEKTLPSQSEASDIVDLWGTGIDQTISELAEIVRRVVGYTGGIDFDPTKPDGTPAQTSRKVSTEPYQVRGWLKKGGRHKITTSYRRESLIFVGYLNLVTQKFYWKKSKPSNSKYFLQFLTQLNQRTPNKEIVIILDKISIHRSKRPKSICGATKLFTCFICRLIRQNTTLLKYFGDGSSPKFTGFQFLAA